MNTSALEEKYGIATFPVPSRDLNGGFNEDDSFGFEWRGLRFAVYAVDCNCDGEGHGRTWQLFNLNFSDRLVTPSPIVIADGVEGILDELIEGFGSESEEKMAGYAEAFGRSAAWAEASGEEKIKTLLDMVSSGIEIPTF